MAEKYKSASTFRSNQPYAYTYQKDYSEPDYHRLPGYKNVTKEEWDNHACGSDETA